MGKKIVAFSAGRPNGNTEIYIKIALEAARAMGVETELIRLHECDLKPCKNCPSIPCYMQGAEGCIIKDDAAWLTEKFAECDGFLLGSPVFALTPCGVVSDFRDRVFGPKMDVAKWELAGEPPVMKGRTQYRPGALISVGGALDENWTSLGLPTLYTVTFSSQINVIDHMDVYGVKGPGEALTKPEYVERAMILGQNLAYAVKHPEVDWSRNYLGETPEEEACPGCHHSLMIAKPGRDYVECAICGRPGQITLDKDGKMKFSWPDSNGDRLTVKGKFKHMREIIKNLQFQQQLLAPVADQIKKYKEMNDFLVRPPKKK